jgi:hypothetical protein
MEDILRKCRPGAKANITNTRRIGSISITKASVGRILNSSETPRLIKVEVVNPTNEKVNDMLDFCLENRAYLAGFSEEHLGEDQTTAVFHFIDEEFAVVFKLKFL